MQSRNVPLIVLVFTARESANEGPKTGEPARDGFMIVLRREKSTARIPRENHLFHGKKISK